MEGFDAAKFSIDENGHVYSSWSFDRNTVIQLVLKNNNKKRLSHKKYSLKLEIQIIYIRITKFTTDLFKFMYFTICP